MSLHHPHETLTQPAATSLRDLLHLCDETTRVHSRGLDPAMIMGLSELEQEALVDKVTPYLTFEFLQRPELHDLPLVVDGYGLVFVSDIGGTILGAETISGSDSLSGKLSEICAFVVPTLESVNHGTADETPILGQTFSTVLILKDVVYKTGKSHDGQYDIEHDLACFQIGVPISHQLNIAASA